MPQYRDNPALWRDRAKEARVQAEQMRDPDARKQMLVVARGYDHLAEAAEQRLAEAEVKDLLGSR